jgi:hypothetical protein
MPGLIAGATLVGASLGGVGAGTAPMTADWQSSESHQSVVMTLSDDNCQTNPTSASCIVDNVTKGVNGKDVYEGGEMIYDGIHGMYVRRAAPAADDGVRVAKPLIGGAAAVGAGATGVAVAKHQKQKKNRTS